MSSADSEKTKKIDKSFSKNNQKEKTRKKTCSYFKQKKDSKKNIILEKI